jgi:diguanylate cyclase
MASGTAQTRFIETRRAVLVSVVASAGLLAALVLEHDRPATVVITAIGLVAAIAWVATLLLFRRLLEVRELALRDGLTGLPNRALLDDRIHQAVVRAERSGEPFALFALDLDGFKEVNDVRGHEAGDAVLVETAARLGSIVRAADTVARVGGDEFVLLSIGTGSEDEAAALVGRIRSEVRAPYVVPGGLVEIDASIGWALFPSDGGSPVELLGRADNKMFQTKRSALETGVKPRRGTLDVGIVREYETALSNGELVVQFQPIVDLATGATVAAEALVRRVHPQRGLITPAEFLPHIERTSVIRELTLHVIDQALRETARWDALGHGLRTHVNVPLRMIDDPVLREGIERLGLRHDIDPSVITLEIAPFGAGTGAELNREEIVRLKRRGVRLALDDFGRASSLQILRTLPVDEVKIDESFVQGGGTSTTDDAILGAVVQLANQLGIIVTAEGVESAANCEFLRSIGVDRIQGYHIERPLNADAFMDWLESPAAALAS